ncbi:hypothetical protein QFZ24_004627 [Streptomyces phaeochromogenes]|nr:hypothetical protein [Streptomyces phaeochromogenes]
MKFNGVVSASMPHRVAPPRCLNGMPGPPRGGGISYRDRTVRATALPMLHGVRVTR